MDEGSVWRLNVSFEEKSWIHNGFVDLKAVDTIGNYST